LVEGYCALLHDGTVACWGENVHGELGRGITADPAAEPTPERVVGLSNVAALEHTCAIDRSDETWCWGRSAYVGDAGVEVKVEPEPVKLSIGPATMIAPTNYNNWARDEATTCAVLDGGLLCWGTNGHVQLEPGPEITAATSIFPPFPPPLPPRTMELPPGAPVRTVALGRATVVLREDGTLLSWGSSPTIGRLSSLTGDPYPQAIALTGVSVIDVNGSAACAVSRGVAYCWGPPFFPYPPYEEGEPTRVQPKAIATPEPLVQIATGGGFVPAYPQRGCGVGVSGAVYCWGNNIFGQAGDGTTDPSVRERGAVKVTGLPAPAAQVKATAKSTCALLTTGKVYCWGDSSYGQLGTGDLARITSTPVEAKLP
jgi:alpha-tubulin suppressor-like RCC1 family protein